MLTLPVRGQKFRDEHGRFRRKTRDDMGEFERLMHDSAVALFSKMADDIMKPSLLLRLPVGGSIGTSLKVRLPSDYGR